MAPVAMVTIALTSWSLAAFSEAPVSPAVAEAAREPDGMPLLAFWIPSLAGGAEAQPTKAAVRQIATITPIIFFILFSLSCFYEGHTPLLFPIFYNKNSVIAIVT
jgi:hypothetical protein